MPLKVKKSQAVHIDEGEYTAVISQISQKDGKNGEYYLWTFLVKGATDDGEDLPGKVKVSGMTSDTFSENSKMYKWAKAAGIDVTEEEIDLEDALKQVVRVYVEDKEGTDGRVWSRVTKVKGGRKGKKAKVEEDDDDEVEAEEEEEEKPKKKKKAKAKKPAKKKAAPKEDTDDDDDDDDSGDDESDDTGSDDDDDLFGDFDDDD